MKKKMVGWMRRSEWEEGSEERKGEGRRNEGEKRKKKKKKIGEWMD